MKQIIENNALISNLTVSQLKEILLSIKSNTNGYYTIIAYANKIGRKIDMNMAKALGRKASKTCRDKGYFIKNVPDIKWGSIGAYPESVLKEIFN